MKEKCTSVCPLKTVIALPDTFLLFKLNQLMGYERRLRVIMNRLHELQFQIATSMPPKKRAKTREPPQNAMHADGHELAHYG